MTFFCFFLSISVRYAMSTDGLLPRKLSYVSQGRHVPLVSTLLASTIIALLATFFEIKVKSFAIVLRLPNEFSRLDVLHRI